MPGTEADPAHACLTTAAFGGDRAVAAVCARSPRRRRRRQPKGKMMLAWHTNIAPRWLDPQQHDGTATPDNFLNVARTTR